MKNHNLDLDPCPDCPYPMDVLVTALPRKQKETCTTYGIVCRECAEEWIELVEDGPSEIA